MSYRHADHQRQTHNALRYATVEEIDWKNRTFRARSGDILTNWLPFPAHLTRNMRRWIPLRIGAQVVLAVDSGDYNTAAVTGMLWSDGTVMDMPESDRPTRDRAEFDDGTVIEYDSARKNLNIHTPGNIHIHADGVIRMDASMIYLNCGTEETWNYA